MLEMMFEMQCSGAIMGDKQAIYPTTTIADENARTNIASILVGEQNADGDFL